MAEVAKKMPPKRKTSGEMQNIPRPNEKLFRQKVEEETKKIDKLKAKLNTLRKSIDEISSGKEEYQRKRQIIRDNLDKIAQEIEAKEEERRNWNDKLTQMLGEKKATRQKINNMKKKLSISNDDDISQKIREIEKRQMTETLSLKEEKQLLADIRILKSDRQNLKDYCNTENLLEDTTSPAKIKVAVQAILDELKNLRQKRNVEKEKLNKLFAERQEATQPLKEIFTEIERVQRSLEQSIATRQQIHQLHNAELRKWQQQNAAIKAQQIVKAKEIRARRQLETQKQQIIRELDKMGDLPYESDILLLEQTIQYVRKLIEERDSKKAKSDENDSTDPNFSSEIRDDEITLLPKNQRGEDYYYAPHHNNPARKIKPQTKRTPHIVPYKHDIGTMSYFEQCGVPAPVTWNDLTTCLEELMNKHKELQEMQIKNEAKYIEKKKQLEQELESTDDKLKSDKILTDVDSALDSTESYVAA